MYAIFLTESIIDKMTSGINKKFKLFMSKKNDRLSSHFQGVKIREYRTKILKYT